MDFFRSGSVALSVGDVEKTVSGLALSFTPKQVVASLRQPASDSADIITAHVVGTPTSDGFSVVLSAPVAVTGYYLDWCAMTDENAPVAGDTLAITYAQIKSEVARFLGYGSTLTEAQATEVDSYIRSGLRQFYYPPKMEGVDETFEWSFLRMGGSVSTTASIGDYTLANGFGRIAGQIYFSGDDRERRPIPIVSIADIMGMRRKNETGAPRFAALTFNNSFGTMGQKCGLMLYPTPDKAYTLVFEGEADTGMINSDTRPYPLGGMRFSELVLESCLAIAEQRANDETGDHTAKFNQLLISAIAKDRKASASTFGQMGDQSDIRPLIGRKYVWDGMKITYHGQTW